MNAPLDRNGLRDVVAMFLQHRWVTSVALAHRAGDDFDKLAEIDQAVEAVAQQTLRIYYCQRPSRSNIVR